MIDKIKIKNFQSLKDVTLELGNITMLTGASDIGKSATLRALNSFFFNNFCPEYGHNGETTFGIAIQKDGHVAFGKRTPKGVEYRLDNTVYTKTAKKCPKDILDFLGIYPYQIDSEDDIFFQIQKQFDRPFLLSDSSAFVAKVIGRISNLNVVLVAMRDLYSSQLEQKQNINFLLSKRKEAEKELDNYNNIDNYESLYLKAKDLSEAIETLSTRASSIKEIISTFNSISQQQEFVNTTNLSLENIDFVITCLENDLTKYNSVFTTVDLLSSLPPSNSFSIEHSEKALNLIDSIIADAERYSSIKDSYASISSVVSSLSSISSSKEQIDLLYKDFPNLDLYINLSSLLNTQIPSFEEKLASYKTSKSEFDKLKEETDFLIQEFSSKEVICPYSKLVMQQYCKDNIL